ncbi:F-box protein 21 [Aspergillus nanangensis]|uniref:F-box protein 21 n=1 Tax=Aspergillus nanangensis TaxID=2582783 RepID=A0AAD4CIC7_ASPNN|nr:F-box protein 21 [Aspergillus nanangensis]
MAVSSAVPDHLARKYYAEALLTSLNRSIAVKEWAKIRDGEVVTLDRALGVFDLFIPGGGCGTLDDISNALDNIATLILAHNVEFDKLSCRAKARAVASYLRANNLTGITHGREYHLLQHNFLGIALMDPDHNSLPLISAAIYCYVAQKLGLNAWPCGFPFHVHVIVRPPNGFDVDCNALDADVEGEPIYMDPFRSDGETEVASMRNQLNLLGVSAVAASSPFLSESGASEIVLRCSTNILNSIQRSDRIENGYLGTVDVISAKYAALWSNILLSDSSRWAELRHRLPYLMDLFAAEFRSDVYLIQDYILPIFLNMLEHTSLRETLREMLADDEIPKQVKNRNSDHVNVRYRVGQVFRHRRYNYTAVITGWDTECGANELWVMRMGIDHLQGGRHQGFYNVLVEDRSVRYVAEENIEPITPHFSDLPLGLLSTAGKHFKRWDEVNHMFD